MFKCRTCESLRGEVEYLRKLVDRTLAKVDVAPVYETEEAEIEQDETIETMKFGEG